MKKFSLLFAVIFFSSLICSVQQVAGQEKTKNEKENEIKVLQAIEEQKKAMADMKKGKEEIEKEKAEKEKAEQENMEQEKVTKIIKDKHMDIEDALKDIQYDIQINDEGDDEGEGNSISVFGRKGHRPIPFEEPFIVSPGVKGFNHFNFGDDSESTTWNYSKNVKESSFSNSYSFDVEKSAKTVVMSVMGDCEEGEIRIKIVMPGGKEYSDVVIDESGNLNWRKAFTISDTENQDKTGEWKFVIKSSKATGYFKISLKTY